MIVWVTTARTARTEAARSTVSCDECGDGRLDALAADAIGWAMRHEERRGHPRYTWVWT